MLVSAELQVESIPQTPCERLVAELHWHTEVSVPDWQSGHVQVEVLESQFCPGLQTALPQLHAFVFPMAAHASRVHAVSVASQIPPLGH